MNCLMLNNYFSSMGLSQQILLHIDSTNKLFISCPSEGLISRLCPKFSIREDEFYFYFLNQKYILIRNYDGQLIFEKTDVIYQTTRIVTFERIGEVQFAKLNHTIKKIQLLIDAGQYENQGEMIHFTYDFDELKISAIKEHVNMENWLDSSSDFNKMCSCLSWVNDVVKHKSHVTLPTKRDTISLLNFARINNGKLNCRGLAIILCELCLAAGLYARYISCNPKDINTDDSHVVVIAFSEELQKWVLLDPSYCLILYDINRVPLSLNEFRDYVIEEREMIVDERANFYGHRLDYYMYIQHVGVKLYRFSSPINVQIGGDENYLENSVHLVPSIKEYVKESPNVISTPGVFWQFPYF